MSEIDIFVTIEGELAHFFYEAEVRIDKLVKGACVV